MLDSSKIRGAIDVVRAGYVEGWACDIDNPSNATEVAVVESDRVVAVALANRYRPDLVANEIGHGWHGFRAALSVDAKSSGEKIFLIVDTKTRRAISGEFRWTPEREIVEKHPLSVDELIGTSAQFVSAFEQLQCIGAILDKFRERNGVVELVDRIYCYVLGRPADPSGLETYAGCLSRGDLRPLQVLEILFNADERLQSGWSIVPPSARAFPFYS